MKLGKKQTDVIVELHKRGYNVSIPDMSRAMNGIPRPKYDEVRRRTRELIEEWKAAEATE